MGVDFHCQEIKRPAGPEFPLN
ncbi:hypothetical protein CCACVL1_19649 [Corchorus capsularis]|uniref:Uncharacterized protein n=1 Tax=Corchorus capsularis TaxID=210143 RepID=A0A1R3HFR4_COCAP|nr:hypothetical protein CCACVL1_19649 [Corchorus capsularis]